jgi:hypothetical protein
MNIWEIGGAILLVIALAYGVAGEVPALCTAIVGVVVWLLLLSVLLWVRRKIGEHLTDRIEQGRRSRCLGISGY